MYYVGTVDTMQIPSKAHPVTAPSTYVILYFACAPLYGQAEMLPGWGHYAVITCSQRPDVGVVYFAEQAKYNTCWYLNCLSCGPIGMLKWMRLIGAVYYLFM
jgi:hypothetical protein